MNVSNEASASAVRRDAISGKFNHIVNARTPFTYVCAITEGLTGPEKVYGDEMVFGRVLEAFGNDIYKDDLPGLVTMVRAFDEDHYNLDKEHIYKMLTGDICGILPAVENWNRDQETMLKVELMQMLLVNKLVDAGHRINPQDLEPALRPALNAYYKAQAPDRSLTAEMGG